MILHSRQLRIWLILAFCSLTWTSDAAEQTPPAVRSPLSPQDAIKQFVLPPGLKIEVVACEPQLVDPVAMRFDEQGRLWVAEMRDYPNPPEPGELPKSQIKLLEDRDGDGRFETMHLFADHLLFATGIQPWQGGVLATISGQIVYLKDTDGDNKADVVQPWFTGFAEKNPQLRVNHPRFALDNRIYAAGGLQGGDVLSNFHPKSPAISLRNKDIRFDPRTETAEAIAGNGQFCMTFDDYNRRFLCHNRRPLMHVVLEDRYLEHNPSLAVPAVLNDVAAEGEQSHIYPISKQWATSHLHTGQFTAACGTDIYRGDALPAEYHGNSFNCEPTGNLVHREVLRPLGATFTSKSPYEGREFLASRDTWCRPVAIESGPDGALYVIDIYRAVIEHPQFMPDELKNRPDLRYGDDRGRIYRIVPTDYVPKRELPNLGKVASADLVKLFEHSNAWWRETAARLLYERQDKSVVGQLQEMALHGREPTARVHALWALEGLGVLTKATILAALSDEHPRVREQAIVLAEPQIASDAELRKAVINQAGNRDARVRFQAALTLGCAPGADLTEPLAAIALAGANDVWTRRAVQTAIPEQPAPLLKAVWSTLVKRESGAAPEDENSLLLVEELANLTGKRRNVAEVAELFRVIGQTSADARSQRLEFALLDGLAQGIRSRGTSLPDFAAQPEAAKTGLKAEVERWFARAAAIAGDAKSDPVLRKEAAQLLAFAPYKIAEPALVELLVQPNQDLRLLAVAALAAQRDPAVGRLLLDNLARQTPSVRGAILEALLNQPQRINLLLDDMAAGKVKPTELDTLRSNRLLASRDPAIKARAEKLLASAMPADRAKALAQYQAALELKADARNGKEVFRKNCSTCHKIDDVGVDVGPSIGDARTKTRAMLLMDILQPSKAIDNNFVSYSVASDDGNSYTGLIVAETPTSITLKMPEGKTVVLLRTNVEEIRSNGISLMPEGLERNIPLQQMADVISFIKNWRYLDGQTPLGEPTSSK